MNRTFFPLTLTTVSTDLTMTAVSNFGLCSTRCLFSLLEDKEAGDDPPSTVGSPAPVQGRLVTRRYGMGTMHTKRFTRVLSDVVLPDTAAITVKANTINPDQEITLVPGQANTSGVGEDYTLKQPIRQKAHYCEIEFVTTANRPEIRTVSIEGALPSRPQTETRHAA